MDHKEEVKVCSRCGTEEALEVYSEYLKNKEAKKEN